MSVIFEVLELSTVGSIDSYNSGFIEPHILVICLLYILKCFLNKNKKSTITTIIQWHIKCQTNIKSKHLYEWYHFVKNAIKVCYNNKWLCYIHGVCQGLGNCNFTKVHLDFRR